MVSPLPDSPTNAILRRLGLPPSRSPNAHSDAAEAAVVDAKSGVAYFERVLRAIPTVPRRTGTEEVKRFLLDVYEWGNFLAAAIDEFVEAHDQETYGTESAASLSTGLRNILSKLYAALGVRLNVVVHPDRFAEAARAWNATDQTNGKRALAECCRALRLHMVPKMQSQTSLARSRPHPRRPMPIQFLTWTLSQDESLTQGVIARLISERVGQQIRSYTVSRYCKRVKEYLDAGGTVPPAAELQREARRGRTVSVDPARLEVGRRRDARKSTRDRSFRES